MAEFVFASPNTVFVYILLSCYKRAESVVLGTLVVSSEHTYLRDSGRTDAMTSVTEHAVGGAGREQGQERRAQGFSATATGGEAGALL